MGGDNNKGGEMCVKTGLPKMDLQERDDGDRKGIITNVVAPCIMTAIGFGIAFAVYKNGSTTIYDAKIQSVASNGMAYCYLSAWVFARLVSALNFYPMRYKSRVMRSKSGNLRVNQFIYKLVGEGAGENAVVLADDGQ